LRIDNKEYFPKPGQLFLMPANIKQSYSVISENLYIKYWCHFTARIGDKNIFDIIKVPYSIDAPNAVELKSIFDELLENYANKEFYTSLTLNANILRLISYYLKHTILEKVFLSQSAAIEKLSQIIEYIDKNLNRSITIENLAAIVHFQPNYFIRFFKKHIGVSPIQYINRKRIDKTKSLLTSTNLTLAEICNETGVGDIHYLSRLFKEHTGFSPAFFRQMMQSEGK